MERVGVRGPLHMLRHRLRLVETPPHPEFARKSGQIPTSRRKRGEVKAAARCNRPPQPNLAIARVRPLNKVTEVGNSRLRLGEGRRPFPASPISSRTTT